MGVGKSMVKDNSPLTKSHHPGEGTPQTADPRYADENKKEDTFTLSDYLLHRGKVRVIPLFAFKEFLKRVKEKIDLRLHCETCKKLTLKDIEELAGKELVS